MKNCKVTKSNAFLDNANLTKTGFQKKKILIIHFVYSFDSDQKKISRAIIFLPSYVRDCLQSWLQKNLLNWRQNSLKLQIRIRFD